MKVLVIVLVVLLVPITVTAARIGYQFDGSFEKGDLIGMHFRGHFVLHAPRDTVLSGALVPLARKDDRTLTINFYKIAGIWEALVRWQDSEFTSPSLLPYDWLSESYLYWGGNPSLLPRPIRFGPYDYTASGRVEVKPTPEPAALMLFGVGMLTLAAVRRRIRKRKTA